MGPKDIAPVAEICREYLTLVSGRDSLVKTISGLDVFINGGVYGIDGTN